MEKVNLETRYLGLQLKNPIVASACPLTKEIDTAKKLEDYGVSAIVMPSLFEEEIVHDQKGLDHFLGFTDGLSFEANDFFPEPESYKNYHGEEYLDSIYKIKKSIDIPIIGSLNGTTRDGWVSYAKNIQDAGADALELNIYEIPTNPNDTSLDVENRYLKTIESVRKEISIPLSVKLAPFFTSFANMAKSVEKLGVEGLVLFNRFLEPDYDLDNLGPHLRLDYSTRYEMRLPLHWIAILHGDLNLSLAGTRGIKSGLDVIKMTMAGADVAMIASLFYQQGIEKAKSLIEDIESWMIENEYGSIEQMKGSMSYKNVIDKSAFERANYMKLLRSHY